VDGAFALLEAIGVGNAAEGSRTLTSLGDVTNTAARLRSAARGGEIVACGETYAALRSTFPNATREVLTLKGKQAPVEAYRIPAGDRHG
jgi:class 3 adenylate cyclase